MTRPDPEVVVTIPDAPPQPGAEPLHQVRVLRAPVRLWDRANQHTAELMREFALLRVGRDSGTARHEAPQALLQLVADLRVRYAGASSNQEAEFQAAVDAGERARDFTYEVPVTVGDACLTLLELLDAADDYCAQGTELMTLVSPPDQQAFRRWYLHEFDRQLRGEPPLPWTGPTD